jgi:membrane protein DedA with SNARE-associated domain
MDTALNHFLPLLLQYKYFALFIGATIEGPVLMAATGFLTKLGYFDPFIALAALVCGDVVSDVLWYYLGYFKWYKKIASVSQQFEITQRASQKITNMYNTHPSKIIFLSKISMGFGFNLIVLVTAGILRIPLQKFIIINFFGGIVWVSALMILGYFFGNMYLLIEQGLQVMYILVGFIVFLITFALLGRYIRAQFLKRNRL